MHLLKGCKRRIIQDVVASLVLNMHPTFFGCDEIIMIFDLKKVEHRLKLLKRSLRKKKGIMSSPLPSSLLSVTS